ncbi:ParA family protein [Shinella curvata]|uniref:ParA family protein n=1 Tax=Shinella curvata TaxID=1817964 RepID=A0ABT8X854_9HYPH|nr:ParA family protein [Shinella curvata]MCJ8052422.1 ParA family protein [Shinella curvata]MDO6119629.1 ParA family protein [Shinella curvata]
MAVISVANAKGGSGKTTAAVLLATEFVARGARTALLDCDDLKLAASWARTARLGEGLTLVDTVAVSNLAGYLKALRATHEHIVIDLSGARDALVAFAAGLSDLVLVPVQGCAMDSRGAAHVLELIDLVSANSHKPINRAVVLSRVNPLVTTRALRSVKAVLDGAKIPVIGTPVIERAAFRDMFETGGTLYSIAADRTSNLDKAVLNMRVFADEVLRFAVGDVVRKPLVRAEVAATMRAMQPAVAAPAP